MVPGILLKLTWDSANRAKSTCKLLAGDYRHIEDLSDMVWWHYSELVTSSTVIC